MSNGTSKYEGVPLRAAIYGRYSSNMQRPASLEDQERNCRNIAAEKGWIVRDEYVCGDKAMTGKMGKNRAALNFLTDAVQNKPRPFDVLIVDELSRLGRKLKNVLELSDILKHFGVKLFIVAQKLDSDDLNFSTLVTLNGMIDEQNSERTRHRVLRGQEGRVREGFSSGSNCFGYRSVQVVDSNGSLQGRAAVRGNRWEVIEEQAKTIQRIHSMFADGMSDYQITMCLNEEGVPAARRPKYGPNRTVWNTNLVKRILTNEKYIGKIYWNRTTQSINPITEKIDTRRNPSDKWVRVDAPHLRIVPDELWNRVQERLKIVNEKMTARRLGGMNRAKKRPYLFSGLLYCGACGSPITIGATTGRRSAYSCVSARYKRGCTNKTWIREDRLNGQLLQAMARNLLTPEAMEYFVGSVAHDLETYARTRANNPGCSLEDLMNREATLVLQASRLVQAITHAASVHSQILPEQLAEVEAKLQQVRCDIELLKAPVDSRVSQQEIETMVRAGVDNLVEVVQHDVLKGREVLQRHINRLTLVPVESEEGAVYEVLGDIDLFRLPNNRDGRILLARSEMGTSQQYTGAVDFLYHFAGLPLDFSQDPWPNPLIAPIAKLLEANPELLHYPRLAKGWTGLIRPMVPASSMLHGRINSDYVAWNLRERSEIFAQEFGMVKIIINRETYYMFRHLAALVNTDNPAATNHEKAA